MNKITINLILILNKVFLVLMYLFLSHQRLVYVFKNINHNSSQLILWEVSQTSTDAKRLTINTINQCHTAACIKRTDNENKNWWTRAQKWRCKNGRWKIISQRWKMLLVPSLYYRCQVTSLYWILNRSETN